MHGKCTVFTFYLTIACTSTAKDFLPQHNHFFSQQQKYNKQQPSSNKRHSFHSRKQPTNTTYTETAVEFHIKIDDDSCSFICTCTATGCWYGSSNTYYRLQKATFYDGLDEVIGVTVAAMGLYAQQSRGGDVFLPFSTIGDCFLSLTTTPFPMRVVYGHLQPNWILWQITKKTAIAETSLVGYCES